MRKVILLLLIAFTFIGCSSLRRLSGQEFSQKADLGHLDKFRVNTFIGVSNKKAYLETTELNIFTGSTKYKVYWTSLSELPKEIQAEIKSGKNPWEKPRPQIQNNSGESNVLNQAKELLPN